MFGMWTTSVVRLLPKRTMREHGTKTVTGLLFFLLLAGILGYFLYNLEQKQKMEQIDLQKLVSSEVTGQLFINRPAEFISVLNRQPQLNRFFQSIIPDDYFRLLKHIKYSPALLACYPKGIVFYYPIYNTHDRIQTCFKGESSIQVSENNMRFRFYARDSNQYFGYYQYKNIIIASYSLSLLKQITKELKLKKIDQSKTDYLKGETDRNTLIKMSLAQNVDSIWQTMDIFLHEKQVCCLLQKQLAEVPDSLIAKMADSLAQKIQNRIPDLEIHSGFSKDASSVYYTFCTPLLSNR